MPPAKAKGPPSLESVLDSINKQHGAGTIQRLGDGDGLPPPEVIPTGSIALDEALRVGGFARGRLIEIFGPESSGKTSVALHAAGNAQRKGLRVAFIDAEQAFDPVWAETLGVDTENLYVTQPGSGEEALVIAHKLVSSGHFGLIIIDSVAALVPEAEMNGNIGDTHVALQARMMSQGLRMLTEPAARTKTAIIFINQLREKVGVFFGNSETQPGGKALKFYASVRLDVRRIQTLKEKDVPVGSRVKVKVAKNKLGRPFGIAEFDFLFDKGISHSRELLDLGVDRRLVKKSGAFYTLLVDGGDDIMIGQGRDNAAQWLDEHDGHARMLEKAVRGTGPVTFPSFPGDGELGMSGPAPWDGEVGEADQEA